MHRDIIFPHLLLHFVCEAASSVRFFFKTAHNAINIALLSSSSRSSTLTSHARTRTRISAFRAYPNVNTACYGSENMGLRGVGGGVGGGGGGGEGQGEQTVVDSSV